MSYKIKSGDTLSALAKKNNTTIAKILAANKGIKNANSIKAIQGKIKKCCTTNRCNTNSYK